jgi:uncharacterized coiled-coil DUF342 family protein
MTEMTEKIERENEELKRLTKELVEARKTQKKFNEEFAQLRRQKDKQWHTAVHNSLQIRLNFLTRRIRPWQSTHLQATRMRIVTRGNPRAKRQKIPQQTYQW